MCSLGEAANAATAKLLKNIEMKWSRIDLSKSTHQLLTSDRPIDMPLGLADPEAYISLPFLRASCSCCLAQRARTMIACPLYKNAQLYCAPTAWWAWEDSNLHAMIAPPLQILAQWATQHLRKPTA